MVDNPLVAGIHILAASAVHIQVVVVDRRVGDIRVVLYLADYYT